MKTVVALLVSFALIVVSLVASISLRADAAADTTVSVTVTTEQQAALEWARTQRVNPQTGSPVFVTWQQMGNFVLQDRLATIVAQYKAATSTTLESQLKAAAPGSAICTKFLAADAAFQSYMVDKIGQAVCQ